MRRVAIVLLSITAALAVDKGKQFDVQPAESYPGHETHEKITIAAVPYNTKELVETAFGKVKPYERGILPVLVVIKNGTGKALRLDLIAQYVASDGQHVEAMPPDDVVRFQGIQKRPGMPTPNPLPIPLPRGKKKGPLNTPEIEGRAWAVRLLPPGESANGFFYFQADTVKGALLYLTGIRDAASGQPYFYFELPLDATK
jgi:hypothetical protein